MTISASAFAGTAGAWREPDGYVHPGGTENYNCPCCGDIVMGDGTRAICGECVTAECEPSREGTYDECRRPPAVTYERIVFCQGDDAAEPVDLLYNRESPDSIVYHGPTAESIAAAFAYLGQWDYGEAGEESDTPSCGTADDTWVSDDGQYLMSAHLGLGYIGLERIVKGER